MKSKKFIRLIAVMLCATIACATFSSCGFTIAKVENFKVDYVNNTLTWGEVKGADHYEVFLSFPPSGFMWDKGERELVCTVNTASFDITNYSDNAFRVKVVKGGRTSNESDEVIVNRNRKLETVSHSISENGVVSWGEVANSTGYKVNIEALPEPKRVIDFSTQNTTFSLADYIDTNDSTASWGIKILSLGSDGKVTASGLIYNNSKFSELKKFPIDGRVPLCAPTVILRTTYSRYYGLEWSKVSHIGKGHYQVFKDGESIGTSTNGIFSFFDISFEPGEYDFTVKSIADTSNSNTIFSDSVFSNSIKLDVTRLPAPQNLRLTTRTHNSSGEDFQAIEWDDTSNNAMTYVIYVNGNATLELACSSAWPAKSYTGYDTLQWALDQQEGNTLVVGKSPMQIQVQSIGFGKYAKSELSEVINI